VIMEGLSEDLMYLKCKWTKQEGGLNYAFINGHTKRQMTYSNLNPSRLHRAIKKKSHNRGMNRRGNLR
jgi:hypothetical protein